MSNAFTLDALREETLKRYEPFVISLADGSSIELKSVLRLGKNDRDAVVAAIEEISDLDDEIDENDEDLVDEYSTKVCDSIEKVFRLIASKPKRLLAELDHEDPQIRATLYTSVLTKWMGESQLGEAKSSPA